MADKGPSNGAAMDSGTAEPTEPALAGVGAIVMGASRGIGQAIARADDILADGELVLRLT